MQSTKGKSLKKKWFSKPIQQWSVNNGAWLSAAIRKIHTKQQRGITSYPVRAKPIQVVQSSGATDSRKHPWCPTAWLSNMTE